MEDYQIRQLGLILAEYTRAMGMQAENKQRELQGDSLAYKEKDFENIASQLEFYANQLR